MILIWVNFVKENRNENIHEDVDDDMIDNDWTEHFNGLHINAQITFNPNNLPVGINPQIL